jgi:hypothetical protein
MRILHFNTRDRDSPAQSNPSDCVIQFPMMRNVRKVFPVASEFPNTQYVVNQYNNVLYYEYGNPAANATFTIPPGNHTATDLVLLLQAEFDATIGAGVITVAFDPTTETFIFTRTLGIAGDFLTFPFSTNPTGVQNPANDLLGFTPWNDHTALFGGPDMVSDKCANLSGVDYIIVDIKELNRDKDSFYGNDVFMKIQLYQPPDNFIFNEFVSSGRLFETMPQNISRLSIKLRNPDGSPYLSNNCDWSFSLAFVAAAS